MAPSAPAGVRRMAPYRRSTVAEPSAIPVPASHLLFGGRKIPKIRDREKPLQCDASSRRRVDVGDGGEAGAPGEVLSLLPRIALEAALELEAGLELRLEHAGVVGEDDFQPGGLQHAADLRLLTRAPGGDEQLHQPSAARCMPKSEAIPCCP